MFKRLSAGLLALTLLLGAAGCSSGKGSAAPTASRQSGSGYGDAFTSEEDKKTETTAAADRKLIKTVELEMETQTYDAFMDGLQTGLAAGGRLCAAVGRPGRQRAARAGTAPSYCGCPPISWTAS